MHRFRLPGARDYANHVYFDIAKPFGRTLTLGSASMKKGLLLIVLAGSVTVCSADERR